LNRPFGPFGKPCVQHFSATLGASRLATAHALGGVENQRPLAGDEPLVVRRVVPGLCVRRTERGELLAVLKHLADGVRLDRCVALGIHEFCAIGQEQGADPLVGVGGRAKRQPEGKASLLALFGRSKEGVPCPACVCGWLAGRVKCLDVDARMLLHQVEPRAAAEQQPSRSVPRVMGTPATCLRTCRDTRPLDQSVRSLRRRF
jgi:hypothetical protein